MAKYRTGRKAPMIDLTKIVRDVVEEYGEEVRKETARTMAKMAPEIVNEVKAKSPVGNDSEHYAEGWTLRQETDKLGTTKVTVYNATKPTLTHLLEFGHRGYPLKNGGRTRDVKGIGHIKPTAEWAEKEVVKAIERNIEQ